jgi:hypothetical protein
LVPDHLLAGGGRPAPRPAAQGHVERCYSSDVMRRRLAEVLGLPRGAQAV